MEYAQMRNFSDFCEQLHEMRQRFYKLDSCERTIALYYLMAGLPFANARFLQHALEQAILEVNTPEAQVMERNANDPTYILNLLPERPQVALTLLLAHLPLLRPGNRDAAKGYVLAIRRILSDFITPAHKIYNECVEIMSYVLVHPAFDREDKKSCKHLLKQVLNPVSQQFGQSPVSESSDESISPNPEPAYLSGFNRHNRRSNSLTQAQISSRESLVPDVWSSQENLDLPVPKPRSYSLSNDNKTLPINGAMQASRSETRLQELQGQNNTPLMKGIVGWLKSLRLHKYSWVFNNMTYEQMQNMTDVELDKKGITKGARHKLVLNIEKLKDRTKVLTELEAEVMNGNDLMGALKKLKGVLQSPLQASFVGEDLPVQFIKVMGKVCTQLLMLRQPSEECLMIFTTLCERAEASDSFTEDQKKRMALWKTQLACGNHVPIYNRPHNYSNHRYQNHPTQTYAKTVSSSLPQSYSLKSSSFPNVQANAAVGAHRHSLGSTTLQNQLCSLNKQLPPIPSVRTHSNVTHPNATCANKANGTTTKQSVKNVDIESSLESLCLQMMEHALGP